ncbi:hypothetical protein QZH41_016736 [Actinostola sp. cb2023]|nr:hypothetical protein QZH41_016736 [Actinostola sp. cb2023]
MYEVNWNSLELTCLHHQVLNGMSHRRQFSAKVLQWGSITRIDLRRNNLTQVPSMIFQLPLLSNLLLSNNKLKDLPELRWVSESLNHLYLSHNALKSLPMTFSWSNLRTLKLDGNGFTEVPRCVCELSALETLNIRGNPISALPLKMGLLSKLSTFEFEEKKIVYPQGWKSFGESTQELIKWLRSLLLKTKPFSTIKLLVIGWQDKGKTTLVHRIRNDLQYNQNTDDRESTKGVEVSEVEMQPKIGRILPIGTKITFQVWDFAGQKEFHLMHMCFLSSVGLFILVWNLIDDMAGIEELKTSLNNISCQTSTKTTVIIVATHLDCVKVKYNSRSQDVKNYIERTRTLISQMIDSRTKDNVHVVDIAEVSCNPSDTQGSIIRECPRGRYSRGYSCNPSDTQGSIIRECPRGRYSRGYSCNPSDTQELKEKIYKAGGDIVKGKGIRVLEEPVPMSFHHLVGKIERLRNTMCKNKEIPIVNRDQLRSLMRDISSTKDEHLVEQEFDEAVEFLKDRERRPENVANNKPFFTPLRRIYRMEYIPYGFFSRLLARLLHYMDAMITEAYSSHDVTSSLPPSSSSTIAPASPLLLSSSSTAITTKTSPTTSSTTSPSSTATSPSSTATSPSSTATASSPSSTASSSPSPSPTTSPSSTSPLSTTSPSSTTTAASQHHQQHHHHHHHVTNNNIIIINNNIAIINSNNIIITVTNNNITIINITIINSNSSSIIINSNSIIITVTNNNITNINSNSVIITVTNNNITIINSSITITIINSIIITVTNNNITNINSNSIIITVTNNNIIIVNSNDSNNITVTNNNITIINNNIITVINNRIAIINNNRIIITVTNSIIIAVVNKRVDTTTIIINSTNSAIINHTNTDIIVTINNTFATIGIHNDTKTTNNCINIKFNTTNTTINIISTIAVITFVPFIATNATKQRCCGFSVLGVQSQTRQQATMVESRTAAEPS